MDPFFYYTSSHDRVKCLLLMYLHYPNEIQAYTSVYLECRDAQSLRIDLSEINISSITSYSNN